MNDWIVARTTCQKSTVWRPTHGRDIPHVSFEPLEYVELRWFVDRNTVAGSNCQFGAIGGPCNGASSLRAALHRVLLICCVRQCAATPPQKRQTMMACCITGPWLRCGPPGGPRPEAAAFCSQAAVLGGAAAFSPATPIQATGEREKVGRRRAQTRGGTSWIGAGGAATSLYRPPAPASASLACVLVPAALSCSHSTVTRTPRRSSRCAWGAGHAGGAPGAHWAGV